MASAQTTSTDDAAALKSEVGTVRPGLKDLYTVSYIAKTCRNGPNGTRLYCPTRIAPLGSMPYRHIHCIGSAKECRCKSGGTLHNRFDSMQPQRLIVRHAAESQPSRYTRHAPINRDVATRRELIRTFHYPWSANVEGGPRKKRQPKHVNRRKKGPSPRPASVAQRDLPTSNGPQAKRADRWTDGLEDELRSDDEVPGCEAPKNRKSTQRRRQPRKHQKPALTASLPPKSQRTKQSRSIKGGRAKNMAALRDDPVADGARLAANVDVALPSDKKTAARRGQDHAPAEPLIDVDTLLCMGEINMLRHDEPAYTVRLVPTRSRKSRSRGGRVKVHDAVAQALHPLQSSSPVIEWISDEAAVWVSWDDAFSDEEGESWVTVDSEEE